MGCGCSRERETEMGAGGSIIGSPSVVVAPASGDSGAIRRATPYADELRASAYPGEVATCYEAFQ